MFSNIYKDKVVLVTGNTGFKGSWLTLWLLVLGAKVIGISDDVPTTPSMFRVLDLESKIKHNFAKVEDANAIDQIISEHTPDFVFHLAAQSIVARSYRSPLETFQTNIMGTATLLDALRKLNRQCTAVLITSDKCYDNVEWTWGYRENDRLGGKDPYSASKACAEIVIHSYFQSFFAIEDSLVRLVSTRAGNVIGGGDWAESRIVPDAVRAWANGVAVRIRRPNATRPWQHVLEPISGYLRAGQMLSGNSNLSGESFNFGPASDQSFTVQEILNSLAKDWDQISKGERVVIQAESDFHEAGLLKLNCDKALHDLHWKPVLNFPTAIEFTSNWYRHYYSVGSNGLYELTLSQLDNYVAQATGLGIEWTL